MKFSTFLLVASLFVLSFSQQWKRVADLPNYDDYPPPNPENQPDPTAELEQIFSKLNPDGGALTKEDYTNLLKDLILGAGRKEVESQADSIAGIQHKLMNSIIDDYVSQEHKGEFTMQNLLQDLEQERLLTYIDKVYKKKLENMDL